MADHGEFQPRLNRPDLGTMDAKALRELVRRSEEELEFHQKGRDICAKNGEAPDSILYRDTQNYFNVSFGSPTKWFVRLFTGGRRKAITTWVDVEEARTLATGFEVEEAPSAFGTSRIYIDSVDQVWGLAAVVLRSLEICKGEKSAVVEGVGAGAVG